MALSCHSSGDCEATTAAAVATVDSHMMLGDILAALIALLGIPMVPGDVDRTRYRQ